MPVKINSLNKIKKKLKINDNGPAQAFLTQTCYKHMDKYVPKDEGNLRTNVSITTNSITYESPYASYQYYGIREDKTHKVRKYTTPGSGPKWDKRMLSAEKREVIREVKNFIKNGGK